jgi:heavy metal translocating P-type ATPase
LQIKNSLQFGIGEMTCASCVGRAQKALEGIAGVTAAQVNLANETAQIAVGDDFNAAQVVETLTAAGYPAAVTTYRLQIENMSCASCVGRVERAFMAVNGVISANVNLATEEATVEVLGDSVSKSALMKISADAGYPATSRDTESTAKKQAQSEILRRNAMIAAILTLPVFLLEMGGHLIPVFHHWIMATIGETASWTVQFILTTIVLIWPGQQFFRKGIPALIKRAPDMNSLVALGAGAAWAYSTVALFLPQVLPSASRAVYFEAAALIVTLILLGRFLEARAKGQTGAAIRKLVGLQPKIATVIRDDELVEISTSEIITGDIIHLRPGEKIAVDGIVTKGASYVNEAMITGEPVPVEKTAGMTVTGGTINGTGALEFRATHVGDDTMLAQIIRMVETAQGAKLPVQDLVNKITLWFVPAVMGLAALTTLAWLIFGPEPALSHALVAGVSVLIIACPCAMGLATPTSIMVGTGRAAELGVLFRQGDALQSLQDVKTVAFDKTGTLTEGRPELTDLALQNGFTEDDVLHLVASVEASSEHPIAQAILRRAAQNNLKTTDLEAFQSITGYGVSAQVEGRSVLIGADRLMVKEGIDMGAAQAIGNQFGNDGKTPLYAAIDGKLAAVIAVADPIKAGTADAIKALHAAGLKVAMITGDNTGTANAIATQLGIDTVVAEVLPSGKVAALTALQQDGPLAFVGDGINDAPALAHADVGIAIGTGTDVAIEAASVVLMSGDIGGVVDAFTVSQKSMQNIRQNLFWAFGYNALLIPVAAGVFFPIFGWLLSPALGAGAMALSSVFVLTNALRLRWIAPNRAKGATA